MRKWIVLLTLVSPTAMALSPREPSVLVATDHWAEIRNVSRAGPTVTFVAGDNWRRFPQGEYRFEVDCAHPTIHISRKTKNQESAYKNFEGQWEEVDTESSLDALPLQPNNVYENQFQTVCAPEGVP